eukprot:scaffold1235_cov51-Attheya_sp.AAC.1
MAAGTRTRGAASQAAVPDPVAAPQAPVVAAQPAVPVVPAAGFALSPARASPGVIDMSDKA